MSTPQPDEAGSRFDSWRRSLQAAVALLGAAWQANPGYTIAATSGFLSLMLAFWLLLAACLGWPTSRAPVAPIDSRQVSQAPHRDLPIADYDSNLVPQAEGEIRQVVGRMPSPWPAARPAPPLEEVDSAPVVPVASATDSDSPAESQDEAIEEPPTEEEPAAVSRFNRASSERALAQRKADDWADPDDSAMREAVDGNDESLDDATSGGPTGADDPDGSEASFERLSGRPLLAEEADAEADIGIESEPQADADDESPQVPANSPTPLGEIAATPASDSPQPLGVIAATPAVDLRLSEPALEPEFGTDADLQWLLPPTLPEHAEAEPAEIAEPVELKATSAEWKSAAPLPPREPDVTSVQSANVNTRVIPAENSEEVPAASPAPVRGADTSNPAWREEFVPRRSAKLKLQWETDDVAEVGRIARILLLVSNIGDAAAQDVRLSLKLPAGVGHPEGQELEQTLGRLKAGETRRIPLIIRPVRSGEVELPVTARAGAVAASSTGVVTVASSKSAR